MRRPLIASAVLLASCSLVPGTEAHREAEARKLLEATLNDAESARFRDLHVVTAADSKPPERIICGRINAKNRMGAYTGFRRFLVSSVNGFAAIDPQGEPEGSDAGRDEQAAFDGAWPKECAAALGEPAPGETAKAQPVGGDYSQCVPALAKSVGLSCPPPNAKAAR